MFHWCANMKSGRKKWKLKKYLQGSRSIPQR
jgi:hypothetical protein